MNNGRKISLKYVLALIFAALFFSITLNSPLIIQLSNGFYKILTPFQDTIPKYHRHSADTVIKDTTRKALIRMIPSFRRQIPFDYKISKDSLDAPIEYTASDSVVLDVPGKKVTLYNKANTKYKDLVLDAYKIQLDQDNQIVVATYML